MVVNNRPVNNRVVNNRVVNNKGGLKLVMGLILWRRIDAFMEVVFLILTYYLLFDIIPIIVVSFKSNIHVYKKS